MTEDTRSTKDRLAALRASTGENYQGAKSTAQEALDKIRARQEADRVAAEKRAEEALRKSKEETLGGTAVRILKGDEKNNIKNLYGLVGVFASVAAPLVGPAQFVSKWTGLTFAFNVAKDAWEDYGGPIRWAGGIANQAVVKPAIWWGKLHWELYKKAAVSHHDDGTKTHHYGRGIASIAFSIAATAAVGGAILDTPVLMYEAGMYAATAKTEQLYINGVHVVSDNDKTEFYTGGCKSAPCTEENSMPMKIQQSQFLVIKSLIESKGTNIWRPETIMTAIPNQSSLCEVTHAGARWKIANKFFDVYPYVSNVSCKEPASQSSYVSPNDMPPPVVMVPHAAPAAH